MKDNKKRIVIAILIVLIILVIAIIINKVSKKDNIQENEQQLSEQIQQNNEIVKQEENEPKDPIDENPKNVISTPTEEQTDIIQSSKPTE